MYMSKYVIDYQRLMKRAYQINEKFNDMNVSNDEFVKFYSSDAYTLKFKEYLANVYKDQHSDKKNRSWTPDRGTISKDSYMLAILDMMKLDFYSNPTRLSLLNDIRIQTVFNSILLNLMEYGKYTCTMYYILEEFASFLYICYPQDYIKITSLPKSEARCFDHRVDGDAYYAGREIYWLNLQDKSSDASSPNTKFLISSSDNTSTYFPFVPVKTYINSTNYIQRLSGEETRRRTLSELLPPVPVALPPVPVALPPVPVALTPVPVALTPVPVALPPVPVALPPVPVELTQTPESLSTNNKYVKYKIKYLNLKKKYNLI